MSKNKLQQFADLDNFKNVLQYGLLQKTNFPYKGKWAKNYFKNENPIVLELACGKGEYAIGLAEINPNRNYIGVEIKGNRLWTGSKNATGKGLQQVVFLRTEIEWLTDFFADEEVNEIWITFCDPYLSTTKAHKRLTSPRFLNLYQQVLKKGGTINVKIDDETLYQYTLDVLAGKEAIEKYPCDVSVFEILENRNDIYNDGKPLPEALHIKTYYEKKHLEKGKKIKYLQIRKTM